MASERERLWWQILIAQLLGFRTAWEKLLECVFSGFPDRLNWSRNAQPEHGWHYSIGWGSRLNKKEKGELNANIHQSALPDCWLNVTNYLMFLLLWLPTQQIVLSDCEVKKTCPAPCGFVLDIFSPVMIKTNKTDLWAGLSQNSGRY